MYNIYNISIYIYRVNPDKSAPPPSPLYTIFFELTRRACLTMDEASSLIAPTPVLCMQEGPFTRYKGVDPLP